VACDASNEELVEGVENMQLLYGEDTDGDGAANRYRSAANIDDFRDVVSVKVGLLVRSPDIGTDDTIYLTKLRSIHPMINFNALPVIQPSVLIIRAFKNDSYDKIRESQSCKASR